MYALFFQQRHYSSTRSIPWNAGVWSGCVQHPPTNLITFKAQLVTPIESARFASSSRFLPNICQTLTSSSPERPLSLKTNSSSYHYRNYQRGFSPHRSSAVLDPCTYQATVHELCSIGILITFFELG